MEIKQQYTVIDETDILLLPPDQKLEVLDILQNLNNILGQSRQENNKPPLQYLVIESDAPEYAVVKEAIFKRTCNQESQLAFQTLPIGTSIYLKDSGTGWHTAFFCGFDTHGEPMYASSLNDLGTRDLEWYGIKNWEICSVKNPFLE